jgi:hypothetical protein
MHTDIVLVQEQETIARRAHRTDFHRFEHHKFKLAGFAKDLHTVRVGDNELVLRPHDASGIPELSVCSTLGTHQAQKVSASAPDLNAVVLIITNKDFVTRDSETQRQSELSGSFALRTTLAHQTSSECVDAKAVFACEKHVLPRDANSVDSWHERQFFCMFHWICRNGIFYPSFACIPSTQPQVFAKSPNSLSSTAQAYDATPAACLAVGRTCARTAFSQHSSLVGLQRTVSQAGHVTNKDYPATPIPLELTHLKPQPRDE